MTVDIKKYSDEVVRRAKLETEALVQKTYDKDAVFRYARAEKSWCERGSEDWLVWELVALVASQ